MRDFSRLQRQKGWKCSGSEEEEAWRGLFTDIFKKDTHSRKQLISSLMETPVPALAYLMTGLTRSSGATWLVLPASLAMSSGIARSPQWLADIDIPLGAWGEYFAPQKGLRVSDSTCTNSRLAQELLEMIMLLVDRREQETHPLSQVISNSYLRIYKVNFFYFVLFSCTFLFLIPF